MGLFDKKPRGKKGEGRSTIFKPINLPTDVADDLKLLKNIYEVACSERKDQSGYPIPTKLSYGQILAHWMDNLESFDPEIAAEFREAKKARDSFPKTYPVDPTEGEVWKMQYFFTNDDGDEVEAVPDVCGTFIAVMDGFKATADSMMLNDWTLINDAGIELDAEQAKAVTAKILAHRMN